MVSLFKGPKTPSIQPQLRASKRAAAQAKEREEKAKERQRIAQEEIIAGRKAGRRQASQRFSLVLFDQDDELGSELGT